MTLHPPYRTIPVTTETRAVLPCWFCAGTGWIVYTPINATQRVARECEACGCHGRLDAESYVEASDDDESFSRSCT